MEKEWKRWRSIPLAALLLVSIGCVTSGNDAIRARVNMPPPVLERSEFLYHRAMPGETFASIAKWYSGEAGKWREIEKANPGMNPWRLKKDDIVKVPVAVASLHADQPKTSTAPRPKAKKSSPASKAVQAGPEEATPSADPGDAEEPVFGPK